MLNNQSVAVAGLGYVGLPLALAFGRVISTIGFDVSEEKIRAYREGYDATDEMGCEAFMQAGKLSYTTNPVEIKDADFIVVAVPTPVDCAHQPDLTPVIKVSEIVGKHMKKGAIVIFESTVYPGVTEDLCVPILERESGMLCGDGGFKVAYSPERINPGDKVHTLQSIVKVVSGQDADTLEKVAQLYELVIDAGVHRASSIKVAEASKVIENTQRDLNISLMNELAMIFDRMDIDTSDVLAAAGTKWNFLPFRPGLVGGHCIGVDPYYLTYKAGLLGYQPDVILAGRKINDGMGKFIAETTVKQLIIADRKIKFARVLLLGLTFKENCEDLRNSRVIDIIYELASYGVDVLVHDPLANHEQAKNKYGVDLVRLDDLNHLDAIVAAVSHDALLALNLPSLADKCKSKAPFIDIKSAYSRDELERAGFRVWRL